LSDRIKLDSGEEDPQRPLSPAPAPSWDDPPAPSPETSDPQEPSGEPPPEEAAAADLKARVDTLTRQKYEAQRQRDEYAQMLAQQRQYQQQPQYQQGQPPDPIEAARAEGRQQAHEQAVAARFNEACNGLFQRGQEEFGDMPDAVGALNAVGYGNRPDVLAALTKLPDGHRVYRELAGNLDNAARVLAMDPMEMAIELAKMSRSGNGVARETSSGVSRAPAPLRSVGGTAAPAAKTLDKMSMAEFIRHRDREERRSRISR
jgi:hypothetical protein